LGGGFAGFAGVGAGEKKGKRFPFLGGFGRGGLGGAGFADRLGKRGGGAFGLKGMNIAAISGGPRPPE
jgi:hypothetical protein